MILYQSLMNKVKNQEVTIFLMNGYQMQGQIVAYDDTVVVFRTATTQHIIYVHAISTITPKQTFSLEM